MAHLSSSGMTFQWIHLVEQVPSCQDIAMVLALSTKNTGCAHPVTALGRKQGRKARRCLFVSPVFCHAAEQVWWRRMFSKMTWDDYLPSQTLFIRFYAHVTAYISAWKCIRTFKHSIHFQEKWKFPRARNLAHVPRSTSPCLWLVSRGPPKCFFPLTPGSFPKWPSSVMQNDTIGFTLSIDEDEGKASKLIFHAYLQQEMTLGLQGWVANIQIHSFFFFCPYRWRSF